MTDAEIIKANDILKKLDFFGGQRAGRELWFEKPTDIQNEDIENFSKDVAFLKDFINRQKAEIEKFEKVEHFATETIRKQAAEIEKSEKEFNDKFNSLVASNVYLINRVDKARTEAIKEFAEKFESLLADFDNYDTLHIYEIKDRLDLVKELTE